VTGVNGAAAVEFVVGDLALAHADAIVNPTGEAFAFSPTGVNRALVDAGGPEYRRECEELGRAQGAAVWPTGAGRLSARFVLHAVVPARPTGDTGRSELRHLHEVVLELASALGCRSVALPAICCGVRGLQPEQAGRIAVPAVEHSLRRLPQLCRVDFVFRNEWILGAYYAHLSADRASTTYVRRLREEIVELLHRDGDSGLAAVVATLEDEATLRAIQEEAARLDQELSPDRYNSSSISLAALYAAAARRVLDVHSQ
jgi:O-acetyl-ADP-ribose deacetylase